MRDATGLLQHGSRALELPHSLAKCQISACLSSKCSQEPSKPFVWIQRGKLVWRILTSISSRAHLYCSEEWANCCWVVMATDIHTIYTSAFAMSTKWQNLPDRMGWEAKNCLTYAASWNGVFFWGALADVPPSLIASCLKWDIHRISLRYVNFRTVQLVTFTKFSFPFKTLFTNLCQTVLQ